MRAVRKRQKEHCDAIRLRQVMKFALAEHVHEELTHEIDWSSFRVIDKANRAMERRMREAMHIHKRKPKLNRGKGIKSSNTWNSVL